LLRKASSLGFPDAGSWARIPETMALSGKWHVKMPEHQKYYDYIVRLIDREQDIMKRGRGAGDELERLKEQNH
jgi:hypothetical protein